MKNIIDMSYTLKVLSDETRLKIIDMLSKEELCACHILEEFEITQPTLSYHMKLLVEAGLVNSVKEGNLTRYSLDMNAIRDIEKHFKNLIGKEVTKREMVNC